MVHCVNMLGVKKARSAHLSVVEAVCSVVEAVHVRFGRADRFAGLLLVIAEEMPMVESEENGHERSATITECEVDSR